MIFSLKSPTRTNVTVPQSKGGLYTTFTIQSPQLVRPKAKNRELDASAQGDRVAVQSTQHFVQFGPLHSVFNLRSR